MTGDSVVALIRSVCAAYALRSGARPARVRLGTEEWDAFDAWTKAELGAIPGDPSDGGEHWRLHSLWVGRLVNVARGVSVEGRE